MSHHNRHHYFVVVVAVEPILKIFVDFFVDVLFDVIFDVVVAFGDPWNWRLSIVASSPNIVQCHSCW